MPHNTNDSLPPSPIMHPTTPLTTNPFGTLTVLQIRTSLMQPMKNLNIQTGIYKQPRPSSSRIFCSFTGLDSDEHDLTFHGGRDKALHQYFHGHYPCWKDDYRSEGKDGGFEIGAFGENLVVGFNEGEVGMSEKTVCIGDVYQLSGSGNDGEKGVLLQVSLPRQPCFKLNHRFSIKNFAPQTYKKSRTGWYYRVLKEGTMGVGDTMVLVERKHPEWCIERVQYYLHGNGKGDLEVLKTLAGIEEFGNECKKAFRRGVERLEKAKEKKVKVQWKPYEVIEKKVETSRIKSFTLQAVGSTGPGDNIKPGSFVGLLLPNGLKRCYSIVGGTTNHFQLGIALDDKSRGGSSYLHNTIIQGSQIQIGAITAGVPIVESASNHIFIAGGIGITAFLGHIEIYQQINYNYTLHYAVRSAEELPFKDKLEKMGERLVVHDASKGERMDIPAILANRTWNSYVYVCGPDRMVNSVRDTASEINITPEEIHYEAFATDTSGNAFEVELKGSGTGSGSECAGNKVVKVGEEQTLLEVLREVGLEVDSSCEVGNCGTCVVKVCAGEVEHRGSGLREEEKVGEGRGMLSCVSRGVGRILIEV